VSDSVLASLLDRVARHIRRYVVLTEHQTTAVALWTVHTHTFQAAEVTPYLNIHSPEKESGKTLLLEVLRPLVAEAWLTGHVSPAVLVRKVDALTPTLLFDESDRTFGGDKESAETLIGVLNTGYQRGGAYSICVGKQHDWKDFSTYCPKAIAGLDGKLPDTVRSRSISIRMKRRAPGEEVERYRRREVLASAELILNNLVEWADHEPTIDHLREARPELPGELSDRAADVWEPPFAIADMAGGEWPGRARDAAKVLSGRGEPEEETIGVRLLADCQGIFRDEKWISTADLLSRLHDLEEAPWGDWSRGNPISARKLSDLLRPFGIKSGQVRDGEQRHRGYPRQRFEDAWARYLHTPIARDKRATRDNDGEIALEQANVTDVTAVTGYRGQGGGVTETAAEEVVCAPDVDAGASGHTSDPFPHLSDEDFAERSASPTRPPEGEAPDRCGCERPKVVTDDDEQRCFDCGQAVGA
jgi:hypothetical protein